MALAGWIGSEACNKYLGTGLQPGHVRFCRHHHGRGPDWVPAAWTLPTLEQPMRVAEFDEPFGTAVRAIDRSAATRLDGAAEAKTRDLTEMENACCSFFTLTIGPVGAGSLRLR